MSARQGGAAQQRGEGHAALRYGAVTLYKAGRITLEDALTYADSRTNLEAKINFG